MRWGCGSIVVGSAGVDLQTLAFDTTLYISLKASLSTFTRAVRIRGLGRTNPCPMTAP